MAQTGRMNEERVNVLSNNSVSEIMNDRLADQAIVNINNLYSHGGVQGISTGNYLGLAKLRRTVILQPHTQQKVAIKCRRVNNHSVYLLEPIVHKNNQYFCVFRTMLSTKGWQYCRLLNLMDEPITLRAGTLVGQLAQVSDSLSSAHDNDFTQTDVTCYLTGEGESRTNGYRNNYGRYSADQVNLSTSNLVRDDMGHRTQTFYSQNKKSAQNRWGMNWRNNRRNVGNYHQNRNNHRRYWFDSDSFAVEK